MTENENKSTGPRTDAGKAASSKNSFKHGLASGQIVITGEDPAAFESLVADLENEYQPATESEALLVHDLAKFYWLKQRAIRLQQAAILASEPVIPKSLDVLMRYQNANQRAFQSTLKSLQVTQKERKKAEEEFVSQQKKKEEEEHDIELRFSSDSDPIDPQVDYYDPSTGEWLPGLVYYERHKDEGRVLKEGQISRPGRDRQEAEFVEPTTPIPLSIV